MAPETIPALLEQIDELLSSNPPDGEPAMLARLERTLTDGYAHALSLEAECVRLECRISDLAGELDEGDGELKTQQLADASRRLTNVTTVLDGLRGTLVELRRRATAARAAS